MFTRGIDTVPVVQDRTLSETTLTCPPSLKDNVMVLFSVSLHSNDWFTRFSPPKDYVCRGAAFGLGIPYTS
eukprot:16363361-Heterocapsa_arctica.AAC.1